MDEDKIQYHELAADFYKLREQISKQFQFINLVLIAKGYIVDKGNGRLEMNDELKAILEKMKDEPKANHK